MIDSRLGVGILATVAVGASILAFAWRVPVPATMTGPIWPNLDANKIHRISVARPGKATIELQRDAGATLDDWHFADLPSVHPSLPSLHDFLAVAASTQWRSKVAAQPEAAMATISIDSAPLVAIGASLPGVGAARWHRGNEVLLVDDWIAAALLSDVDKLQIPGPWRIVDGSPLQVAITGDLTPAHSISFALHGPPFVVSEGTPAQTFVVSEQVAQLVTALNAMAADAEPPSPADLPAHADPSNLVIEVNQQRLAVGAPCVSHSSARLVISEQGAWCIDVARIVVVLAIVNSYADSPQPWIDARPIVGDIKSIRIDDKIELTAHGATWRIASLIPPSEPVDADARAVENLITALHQSTTLVPAGSSTPPRPYLSVTSTASPQPFSFEWDPTQHTLHRNLDPVLLGLSDSAAKILATDRSNFRNRTLWVEDENNIDQLTIVDGNRPLRMVHRGAVIGEWFSNTNSQEGPMADASNIASIAASLRVDAFVAGAKAGRDARSITLHVAAPPFANAAPSTHVISIGRDCIGTVDEQGVRFDATTCATLRR